MNDFLKKIYKAVFPLAFRNALWELVKTKKVPDFLRAKSYLLSAVISYRLSKKGLIRSFFSRRVILCFPELPVKKYHALYRIALLAGYKLTDKLDEPFHLLVDWQDVTVRPRRPEQTDVFKKYGALNADCRDISKKSVDAQFEKVFGYSMSVDPQTFCGKAVQKSDKNAAHDGKVIECPVDKVEDGFVYQRLVNNEFDDKRVYDLRCPIFKGTIPFVYQKYRNKDDRFDNYTRADLIKDASQAFSAQEIKNIIEYCRDIGLDYGELDVLRDKDDKKLYIVDANNTPSVLRSEKMILRDFCWSLKKTVDTFDDVFLSNAVKVSRLADSEQQELLNLKRQFGTSS